MVASIKLVPLLSSQMHEHRTRIVSKSRQVWDVRVASLRSLRQRFANTAQLTLNKKTHKSMAMLVTKTKHCTAIKLDLNLQNNLASDSNQTTTLHHNDNHSPPQRPPLSTTHVMVTAPTMAADGTICQSTARNHLTKRTTNITQVTWAKYALKRILSIDNSVYTYLIVATKSWTTAAINP